MAIHIFNTSLHTFISIIIILGVRACFVVKSFIIHRHSGVLMSRMSEQALHICIHAIYGSSKWKLQYPYVRVGQDENELLRFAYDEFPTLKNAPIPKIHTYLSCRCCEIH